MKNLEFAIRILQNVRCQVEFTVYGPVEVDTYWKTCQELALMLPPNILFKYGGPVEPDMILSVLAQEDLFLFPTHGENYGHVIYEALCAGLPVLISDTTQWRDLEAKGVGWAFPTSASELFEQAITEVSMWEAERFHVVALRARNFALQRSSDRGALESNRALFTALATRDRH